MAAGAELREETGAPIIEVKRALSESGCDVEEARAWLRKKGLANAQKKAGRDTSQGLIAVAAELGAGNRTTKLALVELACETDFVARNRCATACSRSASLHWQRGVANSLLDDCLSSNFQEAAEGVAHNVLGFSQLCVGQLDPVAMAQELATTQPSTFAEPIALLSATMGENVTLRRVVCLSLPPDQPGTIAWYLHNTMSDSVGQIAGAVVLHGGGDAKDGVPLAQNGKRMAMQVVAASAQYMRREDVPALTVAAEEATVLAEVQASGKPDKVLQQMVKGKLNKWYGDMVLLDQKWVVGSPQEGGGKAPTVGKVVAGWSAECGGEVTVEGMVRMAIGDKLP